MENLTKLTKEDASAASARESSSANVAAVSSDCNVTIPIIDMSTSTKEDVSEQMWNAARTVGFFTIINHGIEVNDIDSIFELSKEFFDQSPDNKKQYPFDVDRNSGYEYMTQAPASTNTMDQKESMQITAREGCMDGLWPESPENFRQSTERMMSRLHELACTILSLLEPRACPHLKPGTLAKSHRLWKEDGQCTLRLMHYPPIDEKTFSNSTNLWRAGAHTDWGCITLLFQRIGQDGLECRANPQGDAQWIEVPTVDNGGITVNIGDMLKLWSDDALISNMHRVRMPRTLGECGRSRYSVAFFLQADGKAVIESRTKDPITAGEHFAGRINSHFSK